MPSLTIIAAQIARLAAELPPSLLETLAEVVAASSANDWEYRRRQILSAVPHPRFQPLFTGFLDAWQTQASDIGPDDIALALLSAAATAEHYRHEQIVELVWTGPETHSIPLRRTEQALLQVINAAQHDLLIISFAVYKIDAITKALIRAFERGVHLRICVEAPEPSGQRMAYDTIAALGPAISQRADIYIWPQGQRQIGSHGKPGSLHAKLAIADNAQLFISSANLTAYVMNLNMELGVLIREGPLPKRVNEHFQALIRQNILQRITA